MLHLPDAWVWDFWLLDREGERHAFFLYASRALHDPERRHVRASIGHAVSNDLRTWTRLPDVAVRADGPAFDDVATWTGSAIAGPNGRWYLYYTGLSRAGDTYRQQVGLLTSTDLLTWHRHPANPVVSADPTMYAPAGYCPTWREEHWRDPYVFADPAGDGWHMLLTARCLEGPEDDRGVVGHARSDDLVRWAVGKPLSQPGSGFGQLEVIQAVVVDGRAVLVFSCLRGELAARWRTPGQRGGVWAVAAPSVIGPFDVSAATLLCDDRLYCGRLVQDVHGTWALMGFVNRDGTGAFAGVLSDPEPVRWDGDRLVLAG